jgi:hypothetical protein
MSDFFSRSLHNPNDTHGGGGCLATGGALGEDCHGPWTTFPRVQTEYHQSPYATICQYHLDRLNADLEDEDEAEIDTQGDPLPLRKLVPITADAPLEV